MLFRSPTYLPAAPEGLAELRTRAALLKVSLSTLAGRHLTRVSGGSGRLSASLPQAGRDSATQTPPLRPPPEGTCGQDAGRRRGAQRPPRASPPRRGQTRASRPQEPRCLAKCMGLKFLEKEAQLSKVTVSCPPEGGSPSAPGEPGEVLWCKDSISPSSTLWTVLCTYSGAHCPSGQREGSNRPITACFEAITFQ